MKKKDKIISITDRFNAENGACRKWLHLFQMTKDPQKTTEIYCEKCGLNFAEFLHQ